ncbi:MAG: 5'/3'-nucleotidase SurE [Myxococcota bacterium]|nr:5'/3'-nucleotidase SurE [Myxococcota bacterium]
MQRVLITNDDGVWAPGLELLRECACEVFDEVVVVAPSSEMSGVSQGLTLHDPLRLREVTPGVWRVNGTPADCVIVAMGSVCADAPPDLVLSGINRGPNLGRDVYYSGTVAGAREGRFQGAPAVALSLVGRDTYPFESVRGVVLHLLNQIRQKGLAPETLLNVNIPVPDAELAARGASFAGVSGIAGVDWTRLGRHTYDNSLIIREDPRGRPYMWIGGQYPELENRPGTDCHAIRSGRVSVTPIGVELTDEPALKQLQETWTLTGDNDGS